MESVKIIECPRDAWQGLPKIISTEVKVAYLAKLIEAGFRHLDAVSFVAPTHVPQMADSEVVMRELAGAGLLRPRPDRAATPLPRARGPASARKPECQAPSPEI